MYEEPEGPAGRYPLWWAASVLAVAAVVVAARTAPAADTAAGVAAPRYSAPTDCPRFAEPQFISRPLAKAYPHMAYSMRPAIKGGEYPYTFALAKAPARMKIDARRGEITWTAPATEGTHDVEIVVKDAAARSAAQAFTLTVGRAGFYFVSPTGDDAGDGSAERPWRTVMRAANPPADFTYPAGAAVVLRGGVYKVAVPPQPGKRNANVLRIDARSPSYWLAWPGEKPVIDLGWSAARQQAAHAEQKAAGNLLGGGKVPSTQSYGHRIAFTAKSGYLYMDGLEIRNACYYMIVMWDGGKTIHLRRMDLHHLWADWAENPAFVFTFSGSRKGDFNAWGVRPRCNSYRNFVIQDCHIHDRFYVAPRGGHGGGMVFYTVRDAVVEDNVIEKIHRGECFCDKDNGFGNTYRGNILRGRNSLLGQWNNDETEICHNTVDGELRVGLQPGWLRNIWVHDNTIRGAVSLMGGGTRVPDKLDETAGDFSKATTADSARVIRDVPADKRLVHFYRNVLAASRAGQDASKPFVVLRIPNSKQFPERWRYVRWDQNVVDTRAKVELLWNRYTDWSLMKRCGFDARGTTRRMQSYSTRFPLDEDPISEGSKWLNGGKDGVDWHNVIVRDGAAYGAPSNGGYTDPTALLRGTWGRNQIAEAKVFSRNPTGRVYQEVEIRLRSTLTPRRCTGYEVFWRCLKTKDAYVQVVRWNGKVGDWTSLAKRSGRQFGVKDGDIVAARVIGNVINGYINGVEVISVMDDTYAAGSPGMGFNYGVGTTNVDFGFTEYGVDTYDDR